MNWQGGATSAGASPVQVIFDVRTAGFTSWFAFAPLVILLAALLIEIARRRQEVRELFGPQTTPHIATYVLAGTVLSLLTGVRMLSYVQEKKMFVSVLKTNQARVVEGVITHYVPQEWTGRPLEKFQVGAEQFSFDGFGASSAYHERRRSGGRLREGMRVRVFEFQGNILRIESLPQDTLISPE